jgi:hypothetical protein
LTRKRFAVVIARNRVFARPQGYHWSMATAAKRLDVEVGELVEIAGRHYEVVPDREGGVAIEPSITPATELHEQRGTKAASTEDFERLSADVPYDNEG